MVSVATGLGVRGLTQLGDLAQFQPGTLFQNIAVVSLTCDINTKNDGLVEHLVELGRST